MEERLVKMSRTIAYALRHHPENFALTLDDEGWVDVQDLLTALQARSPWQNISIDDLNAIIAQSSKQRFEIHHDMIRAYYGHSVSQKIGSSALSVLSI